MIKGDKVIQPNISSNVMVINGISIVMDVAAGITDDCTMLPFKLGGPGPGRQVELG